LVSSLPTSLPKTRLNIPLSTLATIIFPFDS
jgi:hypothetical protein